MAWPNVQDFSWLRKKVLKYRTGTEPAETLVVYSSCVTPNTDARRLLHAGTILTKITTGTGIGKYGPYLKTAADGRQTVDATNQAYVLLTGKDVTLGDQAVEGLWVGCVFNRDVIDEVNAISETSAQLTLLKAAFPNSEFA